MVGRIHRCQPGCALPARGASGLTGRPWPVHCRLGKERQGRCDVRSEDGGAPIVPPRRHLGAGAVSRPAHKRSTSDPAEKSQCVMVSWRQQCSGILTDKTVLAWIKPLGFKNFQEVKIGRRLLATLFWDVPQGLV